jgi:hypothetical protein
MTTSMTTLVKTSSKSKTEDDIQDDIGSGIPGPFPLDVVKLHGAQDQVGTVPEILVKDRVLETNSDAENGFQSLEVRIRLICSFKHLILMACPTGEATRLGHTRQ